MPQARPPRPRGAARSLALLEPLEGRVYLSASDYFALKAVDSVTGRGVPQVDFVASDGARYTTDNAGNVAFHRPGQGGAAETFTVESYGYGPGWAATAVTPTPNQIRLSPQDGVAVTLPVVRSQIAQRLYRETGQNTYDESIKLGRPSPVQFPLNDNASIDGQDTVQTAIYKDKIYWFYGDTFSDFGNDNAGGFFGGGADSANFRTTVATSDLPASGGLSPDVGTNRTYVTNADGGPKSVFPESNFPTGGLYWLGVPFVVNDAAGNETMVANYTIVNGPPGGQHGFARWNDVAQEFDPINTFSTSNPINPSGSATTTTFDGQPYYVLTMGMSQARVPASYAAVTDITQYEVFTPFAADTNWDDAGSVSSSRVVRDAAGAPVWAWRKNVKPMSSLDQENFVDRGLWTWAQTPFALANADNPGQHVAFSSASISYNAYRGAWTMVGQQVFGDSFLGETWYSEAPGVTGPWATTRKVATNAAKKDSYTFYNLWQHPYFSAGSKYLYFEGTNTDFLVGGGLRGEFFDNADLTGYKFTWVDPNLDVNYGNGSPDPRLAPDTFSARWTGKLKLPDESGSHVLRVTADDGFRLLLNGQLILDKWDAAGGAYTATYNAPANAELDFRLEYRDLSGPASLRLEWARPSSPAAFSVVPSGAFSHPPLHRDDNYNQFMYRLDLSDPRLHLLPPPAAARAVAARPAGLFSSRPVTSFDADDLLAGLSKPSRGG